MLGIGFSKFEVTSLECLKLRKEEFRFELSTPHFTLRTSLLDAGCWPKILSLTGKRVPAGRHVIN